MQDKVQPNWNVINLHKNCTEHPRANAISPREVIVLMTLYDADMGFGSALIYKTASSNLSIYIFQGNSPDFPNKNVEWKDMAGIGEKRRGVGNVNSQSN